MPVALAPTSIIVGVLIASVCKFRPRGLLHDPTRPRTRNLMGRWSSTGHALPDDVNDNTSALELQRQVLEATATAAAAAMAPRVPQWGRFLFNDSSSLCSGAQVCDGPTFCPKGLTIVSGGCLLSPPKTGGFPSLVGSFPQPVVNGDNWRCTFVPNGALGLPWLCYLRLSTAPNPVSLASLAL